ncbi:Glycosyltransferase, catalytic subunit of cellulose synthase and poly-beta-1,6-N-acetylglucosamine synthase [Cyclobacterium lianum]|uniref:Glycosyltransferase, catalytic subunit of cellulose synthase and poly-beta-1,6-N-acetylglucosamine synthase n=1 Tax=Cyclobacterium lianum TaxID=388280 RepID=A0A1M7QLC0_9BACT|nr:glycosyltransferase family A protein [Cyclobacterium lianum]SHN31791.1 Glycosyltransferase, catalytic subunit of cellulose synthase and poly-beta-1,6-N-acetylglucosamine synthase [Cyclobacterium lianum]
MTQQSKDLSISIKGFSPLVSIIIPLYNKEDFVEETLLSALNQSYSNIEILVINDGSTDHSLNVINKYICSYPSKIRLIDQRNKGACNARNVGIRKSNGEYLQFLDADDLLDSDKISSQIDILSGQSSDCVVFGKWIFFESSLDDFMVEDFEFYKDYKNPHHLLIDLWNSQQMIASFCWLIPRSIILKSGTWDESLYLNQDGDFFSRVILSSKSVVFSEKSMGYYRKPNNNNNILTQKNIRSSYSLFKTFVNYEKNISHFGNGYNVRKGLIKNYEHFIYRMSSVTPELCIVAFEKIKRLKGNNFPYRFSHSKLLYFSQFFGIYFVIKIKIMFVKLRK